MEGHAPTTRMISEGEGDKGRASDLRVEYEGDAIARDRTPVHRFLDDLDRGLAQMGEVLDVHVDRLGPVLAQAAEPGDVSDGVALPGSTSPLAERIAQSAYRLDEMVRRLSATTDRLEV